MFSSTFAQLRNLIKTAAAATTASTATTTTTNTMKLNAAIRWATRAPVCLPACQPACLVCWEAYLFLGVSVLGQVKTSKVQVKWQQARQQEAPLSLPSRSLCLTNLMKQCVSCVKVSSNKRIRICICVSFRYNSVLCTHCCYLCGNQSCVAIREGRKNLLDNII